jgi:purine-binding chemotaxis protein CheW
MADGLQLCTFMLDELFLGVHVLQVQEVIRSQQMTPVPLAPPAVIGLINLRGQIVTAIDLRRRFGLPDRADDAPPMNVVVRTDDGAVSLLVDEIGDVIEVSADAFEPTPEMLDASVRDVVSGIYKLADRLLLVVNIEHAVMLESGASAPANTSRTQGS